MNFHQRREWTPEEHRLYQREWCKRPHVHAHRLERQRLRRAGTPVQSVRCDATCHKTGRRCKQWASIGRTKCKYHGGSSRAGAIRFMGKYAKYLGPTLREAMASLESSETHREMLQLYDEIGLARAMLQQQLPLASVAIESDEASNEAKMLAVTMVRSGIDQIAELCGKMAAIEARAEDVVSVRQLGVFVEQIVQAVYDECGDNEDMAKRLAESLRGRLRMPGRGAYDPGTVGKVPVRMVFDVAPESNGQDVPKLERAGAAGQPDHPA